MADSFVVMDSEQVKKIASDVLKAIEDYRSAARKVLFDQEKARPRPIRKLLRLPPLTDDQILEILKDDFEYRGLRFYAWRSEQAARKLLKAARVSSRVHVSAEDLHWLIGE